ncbi:MAG: ABC transporter permease subunit [Acidobacteriota bacterium]|jgi:sodium transport system permease protein|nr:ABC transporter permease subunit [Acidobacteriota bacterium]
MNWRIIRYLTGHELRMLVRDRRSMMLSVVLPLVLIPLMFYVMKFINEGQRQRVVDTVFRYAVTGSEAGSVRALIAEARKVRPAGGGSGTGEVKLEEVDLGDPAASLQRQEIHFYIEALSGAQADALERERKAEAEKKLRAGRKPAATGDGAQGEKPAIPVPVRLAGVPLVQIYYHGDRNLSQVGADHMRDLLWRGVLGRKNALLEEHGFPYDPASAISVEDRNLASPAQTTGALIGKLLTPLLVMLIFTGGSIAAIDSVAGEKERGSLETLLTTAVKRTDVAAAKQLAILAMALTITVVQVSEIVVLVTFKVFPLPEGMGIDVTPVTAATMLSLFIPLAAFLSAVLLLVSARAKSYKEANLYFLPALVACLAPAFVALLQGVRLRSAAALVPVANVSVAVRDVMVGKFDWPLLAVVFLTMAAVAAWTARVSARQLSDERLVMAGGLDAADLSGGAALFPKRVLRWYLLLWVVFFVGVVNVPQLSSFRAQLVFVQLGVFLGGSLLMMRRYRLDVREAWALRLPKASVWPATLLMIPAAHVVATGVFRLASLVFPVPTQLLEQFSGELVPQGVPFWQMLVFIAVLPGVCEELAFRGTLLYGLRRRFHPALVAVVAGVIFGLFHVDYFRIAQTSFLGVVLAGIALLTGSIFPGMLLHIGNNALAHLMDVKGWEFDQGDWRVYAAGTAVFALCLLAIYRNRTPYPGLRARQRPVKP